MLDALLADAIAKDLATAVLGTGGFLSWILPFAFSKREQAKKLICFAHRVSPILQSEPKSFDDLSVRYADHELTFPVQYTLYVWNCGTVTITGADLAKSDPFGFGRSDLNILETTPVWSTRDGVNAQCRIDSAKNKLLFEFDVLAPNDGFAVDFLADLRDGKRRKLDLKGGGTINGLSRPPFHAQGAYDRAKRWQGSIAVAGLTVCLVSTFLMALDAWNSGLGLLGAVKILAMLLFAAGAMLMAGLLMSALDRSTVIKVPRLLYRSQYPPIERAIGA